MGLDRILQLLFNGSVSGFSVGPLALGIGHALGVFSLCRLVRELFGRQAGARHEVGRGQASYDQRVDAAVRTSDRAERLRLYGEAQRQLLEQEAAIAPLYVAGQNMLIPPGLEGVVINGLGDIYLGQAHWISGVGR